MNAPKNEMLATAEHLRKHTNATPEVTKAAQAVADFASGQPESERECPSLSQDGLALELERRAEGVDKDDKPDGTGGHFEWSHIGANLRRMVPGLKEPAKKAEATAQTASAPKEAKKGRDA